MYILLDHIGRVTCPLGDTPLEACLKFCEYVRKCPTDGMRYPLNCAKAAFEAFQWEVTDGTASELFNLVAETSRKSKVGTTYSRIFEITVVPRPPCWQCTHWKADGVFCMHGEREQSSDEPACQVWAPPMTPWKDIPRRQPKWRQTSKLTGEDRENFQSQIVAFMKDRQGVVSVRDLKRRFKRSDIHTALRNLTANGTIVTGKTTRKGPGRPTILYQLASETA